MGRRVEGGGGQWMMSCEKWGGERRRFGGGCGVYRERKHSGGVLSSIVGKMKKN